MKTTKLITAIALIIGITVIAGDAIAQRGQRAPVNRAERGTRTMENCMLDLTPDQQAQISTLRTNHLKEVTPLRNQLNEKRARLQTLKSADTYNLTEINKTIDEMAEIRATLQKRGAAQRAEVSKLLTDEQRVHFNARRSGKMGGRGQAAMGRGTGAGRGYSKW